jgi:hypothetical protein
MNEKGEKGKEKGERRERKIEREREREIIETRKWKFHSYSPSPFLSSFSSFHHCR